MIVERRSLKISLLLHLGLLLVAAFGLPAILPDAPEPLPLVMTVEVLPISEMTNVKPSDKPIQEEKKAPVEEKMKEPTPPEAKPEPKQETPEEEAFDPDAEKEPEQKQEKKKQDAFEKLLNDLKKESNEPDKKAKDDTATEENKTKSDAPYDETQPLSLSEEDALRNAYIPCWSPPAGAKNAESLIVILRAQYNTTTAELLDAKLDPKLQSRYASDAYFRAAADSALRAVRHPQCNPLSKLPPSLYPKLRDTELTFDPRLML